MHGAFLQASEGSITTQPPASAGGDAIVASQRRRRNGENGPPWVQTAFSSEGDVQKQRRPDRSRGVVWLINLVQQPSLPRRWQRAAAESHVRLADVGSRLDRRAR